MKINRIRSAISKRTYKYINQRRGWKTNRKIIVIESDDWGSIRMPDRGTYERVLKFGIRVDKSTYNKYDTLASNDDFEHLYNVLTKHRDKNGRPPVITANTVVANPDFDKIKNDNFEKYHYEKFTTTMAKYKNRSFSSWQEGIDNGFLYPQLHGREHLNVERWLRYLKKPSKEVRFSFDNGLFGIGPLISNEGNPSFVNAFDQEFYLKSQPLDKILKDACELFENIFGYQSRTFIAPNYTWSDDVEKELAGLGVKYLQGTTVRKMPNGLAHHFLGEENIYNQAYLIRNVEYEPSDNENKDWNCQALNQIDTAFKLHKPAIVCMHRVNFIGSIFEENRTKNLNLFDDLLSEIVRRWPEVEFMSSEELSGLLL